MADFMEKESRVQPTARQPPNQDNFPFGCELSASISSFTFKVDEEDDCVHILTLRLISLGDGVKDECNVVEVVALDRDNKEVVVPIVNLKISCQPMVHLDNFEVRPPVTFRLKSGSGPVHVTGHHIILSHDEVEEDRSKEEDMPPIKPAKKRAGNAVINLT